MCYKEHALYKKLDFIMKKADVIFVVCFVATVVFYMLFMVADISNLEVFCAPLLAISGLFCYCGLIVKGISHLRHRNGF